MTKNGCRIKRLVFVEAMSMGECEFNSYRKMLTDYRWSSPDNILVAENLKCNMLEDWARR